MFNLLRIFSWFLLTSGVVGFIAVALGVIPGIGSVAAALGVIFVQIFISSLILVGFKLYAKGMLSNRRLSYGGWILIAILIAISQYWVNNSAVNI